MLERNGAAVRAMEDRVREVEGRAFAEAHNLVAQVASGREEELEGARESVLALEKRVESAEKAKRQSESAAAFLR